MALVRAQHVIRRYFKGDLMQLRETLRSLADLVLSVEQHEALAELDEDEYIQRIEAMRLDIEKGRRIVEASKELDAQSLTAFEQNEQGTLQGEDTTA